MTIPGRALVMLIGLMAYTGACQPGGWSANADNITPAEAAVITFILDGDIDGLVENLGDERYLSLAKVDGTPLLVLAAREATPETVRALATKVQSLDETDQDGNTAIMAALESGRVENAKVLRSLGASLAGVNKRGATVRYLAELHGIDDLGPRQETVVSLPTVEASEADVLMLLATEAGDIQLVQAMLAQGAALGALAENDLSALHLAALGGHREVFSILIDQFESSSPADRLTIMANSDVSVVEALIAGEGNGDHTIVDAMLDILEASDALRHDKRARASDYARFMRNIGYPEAMIRKHFSTQ